MTELDRNEAIKLWGKSGVEDRHAARKSLELYENHKWYNTLLAALKLIENNAIIALLGDRGTGKTQLAAELIRLSCIKHLSCKYIRCREIGMRLREAYGDNKTLTEKQAIYEFVSPKVLVIDECQERPDKDFEAKSLTMLVDTRYAKVKPTIMIANCTEKQFKDLMGPSIIDRIKEGGGALMCDWPSFRKGI